MTAGATARVARAMMGGQVSVHITDAADAGRLEAVAARTLDRLEVWVRILTRFTADSELSRLNASGLDAVPVRPTLAAVLDWARTAESATGGLVDVALLDARLAAELGTDPTPAAKPRGASGASRARSTASRRWSLQREARGTVVHREPGVRLDLDGVAKGWLADRALAMTPGRSVLVDGDGDIAARVAPGDTFHVGIADPRTQDEDLVVLRLEGPAGDHAGAPARAWGLATSGTSVHRWQHGERTTHHLIDPASAEPATTDVVQATVLAGSARAAEVWAKAAVIVGADRALDLLDRPDVHGAVILTADGEVRATPGVLPWLL